MMHLFGVYRVHNGDSGASLEQLVYGFLLLPHIATNADFRHQFGFVFGFDKFGDGAFGKFGERCFGGSEDSKEEDPHLRRDLGRDSDGNAQQDRVALVGEVVEFR